MHRRPRPTVWCTTVRACRGSSRRRRAPSSSAGPESAVASAGRPSASHACSASAAGSPNGTVRCLLPLPSTRSSRCELSTSSTSSPHSSLTRIPVAYNNSTISRSRKASGSPCCAPDFAADMASSAWSWRSTAGRVRSRLGHLQPGRGIAGQQSAAHRPRGEGLDRRRAARQRGASRTGAGPRGQPRPQHRQAQVRQSPRPAGREMRTATADRRGRRVGCAPSADTAAPGTVELVEDRLHCPTVAETRRMAQVTRRSVSGVRSFSVG